MIYKTKSGLDIHINEEAYILYKSSSDNIKDMIKYQLEILSSILLELKLKYVNVDSVYVSSAYRPQDRKSPHSEARALDISRLKIDGKWYKLMDNTDMDEWLEFYELTKKYFNDGIYNQVLSPYGVIDIRILSDNKIDKLVDNHQDHFHLNIPRGYNKYETAIR